MRVVAIVQARMGSERLPGKVLLDIAGQTMLSRVVMRLRQSKLIDEVVVATTTNPIDQAILDESARLGVRVTRGSEEDVLGRYVEAAEFTDADVIVRVSADSPFVDPEVTDAVVFAFVSADPPVDYASNKLLPSFPLGLDVEAFSRDALVRAANNAAEPYERAHVTVYMYSKLEDFTLLPVAGERNLHSMRWTVDTPADLEFARAVFDRLGRRNDFSWKDVVSLIEKEPSLAELNSHVVAKAITAG
jgi:spore coat polysaccharide biosynthesis protein SpsF (cytidylyltransferase family)